jgi:tRNA-modifying protein YgfZ
MTEGLRALRDGRALVDLASWRAVVIRGAEAGPWLNDLLTAELEGLAPGQARRSLLLSPTGRIRADVVVTPFDDGYLLVQDPLQPSAIDALLEPYVLSSDVAIEDRSGDLRLYAAPDPVDDALSFRPGPLGMDRLLALPAETPSLDPAALGLVSATEEDLDAFRIERGIPRVGVDLAEDSLPHEADLGDAIAYGKGCFLGQEAVAKVRNLGHPPFVVFAVRAAGSLVAGDPVLAKGREVGRVTSAAGTDGATSALVRIRWPARNESLVSAEGAVLERGPAVASAAG